MRVIVLGWCLLLCCFISGVREVSAQIKPGKEGIQITLDPAFKWKSKTEKSEYNAIRKTTYQISGKNSQDYPIQTLVQTTIDKRYYTILTRTAVLDKINYYQSQCAEAVLDLRQQGKTAKGNYSVYVISAKSESICMDHVFIGLAVDGETAFHGVEIQIPKHLATDELIEQWTQYLSTFKIY